MTSSASSVSPPALYQQEIKATLDASQPSGSLGKGGPPTPFPPGGQPRSFGQFSYANSAASSNSASGQTEEWQFQFFKTKLCPYHLSGRCMNGTCCRFAHNPEELRPLPDLHRTKLCESYVKNEPCRHPNCPFAHTPCELRTSSHSFYKVTLCNFYKKGRCWNGVHCRFAHGASELQNQPASSPRTPPPSTTKRSPASGSEERGTSASKKSTTKATSKHPSRQASGPRMPPVYTADEPFSPNPFSDLKAFPCSALKPSQTTAQAHPCHHLQPHSLAPFATPPPAGGGGGSHNLSSLASAPSEPLSRRGSSSSGAGRPELFAASTNDNIWSCGDSFDRSPHPSGLFYQDKQPFQKTPSSAVQPKLSFEYCSPMLSGEFGRHRLLHSSSSMGLSPAHHQSPFAREASQTDYLFCMPSEKTPASSRKKTFAEPQLLFPATPLPLATLQMAHSPPKLAPLPSGVFSPHDDDDDNAKLLCGLQPENAANRNKLWGLETPQQQPCQADVARDALLDDACSSPQLQDLGTELTNIYEFRKLQHDRAEHRTAPLYYQHRDLESLQNHLFGREPPPPSTKDYSVPNLASDLETTSFLCDGSAATLPADSLSAEKLSGHLPSVLKMMHSPSSMLASPDIDQALGLCCAEDPSSLSSALRQHSRLLHHLLHVDESLAETGSGREDITPSLTDPLGLGLIQGEPSSGVLSSPSRYSAYNPEGGPAAAGGFGLGPTNKFNLGLLHADHAGFATSTTLKDCNPDSRPLSFNWKQLANFIDCDETPAVEVGTAAGYHPKSFSVFPQTPQSVETSSNDHQSDKFLSFVNSICSDKQEISKAPRLQASLLPNFPMPSSSSLTPKNDPSVNPFNCSKIPQLPVCLLDGTCQS